ncbi:HlyD family secretion protein, partial [Undibacterium sp. 10I3]
LYAQQLSAWSIFNARSWSILSARQQPSSSKLAKTTDTLDTTKTTDAAQLEVHLYAPSRTAGFVANGQQVLIRYQAYPYQKFGLQKGTVTDISDTPFAPNELPP